MRVLLILLLISLVACIPQSASPIEDYKQARHLFWQNVYPTQGSTLYCQEAFRTADKRGINVEHVFPCHGLPMVLIAVLASNVARAAHNLI